jgi:hypothetical protein
MRNRFASRNNKSQCTPMTQCSKGGIKIRDNKNEYSADPFEGINPFNNPNKEEPDFSSVIYDKKSYANLDLNIENYSREDIFNLFGIKTSNLTENIMKECKKIVLKTHPDKSQLENKYFIFFSSAYKKLFAIYEFQNKTTNKKQPVTSEYYDTNNGELLDKVFETNKNLKDPKNFNSWFNDQFEKHRLEDPIESGYGNWLKSDEDIVYLQNVNKANMASEMEKHKKHVQSLTVYNGVNEINSSTFGGSSLMEYDSNFTSGSLFSNDGMGYTDLRQAYAESVIPVTEEDYRKAPKFKNVDEYKNHRNTVDTTPLSKEEAMRQLYQQNKTKDEESAALAYYYAKQSEKAKKNEDSFWSGLKQITNW